MEKSESKCNPSKITNLICFIYFGYKIILDNLKAKKYDFNQINQVIGFFSQKKHDFN